MRQLINAACLLVLASCATAAHAKPAKCFTTDDGHYPCEFVTTDAAGSFEISGEGKPTYSFIVDEPGVAAGFVDFGDRNIFLPGRHLRSESDPACWVNDETETQICAW